MFEGERFGGQNVLGIEQDFYGVLFLARWESVLSKSAERESERQSQQNACRDQQQVHHSVSDSAM